MSGSFFTLNQKYNNLKTQALSAGSGGVPTSSTLADVLLNGNNAGASNIDMNGNEISYVSVIDNIGNSITIGNGGADNIIVSATDSLTLIADGSIGLTAKDTSFPSGKGISITSDTPNVYYQLATGVNDRLTIDNNGIIDIISVTNGLTTSVGSNSLILQTLSGATIVNSLDMTCDTGLDFKLSGVTTCRLDPTELSFTASSTMDAVGYRGNVYHTDNPTTNATYYMTFVQSGGVSGYFAPAFDSSTLTYNPSTNLMAVNGLQLTNTQASVASFTTGVLTIGGNDATQRSFSFEITANMTGININNRRINATYTIAITNGTAAFTISNTLSGSGANRTNYLAPQTISVSQSWIMTIKIQQFGSAIINCISLERFL